jgi:two-component system, NtrC family, response regulator GlrR
MGPSHTDRISRSDRLRIDRQSGHIHRARYQVTVESGPDAGQVARLDGTLFIGTHAGCALKLTDSTVSRYHLELMPSGSGVRARDLESTNGTYLAGARIESVVVEAGARFTVGATVLRIELVEEDLGVAPSHRTSFGRAIGSSLVMRRLFGLLERAAKTDATVVLLGETGTGKELLAEGLHRESKRKDGPFVVLDCSSLSPGLVESQLFGHVKGAFTDARSDRPGAFRDAHGGTLFIDEIGELPLEQQPKLLRALEAGTVKAVGGDEPHQVDVRVVAATHKDLEAEVKAGRFRRDLYFRLAVVTVWVPSLRERVDDLEQLCRHFLTELGHPEFVLPPALLARLRSHDWPGNVRELRNTVERAVMGLSFDASAPPKAAKGTRPSTPGLSFKEAKEQIVEAFTKDYLAALLEQCGGNLTEVARVAGINRNHVRRLAQRHGLLKGD